jgi:hypothetical protein
MSEPIFPPAQGRIQAPVPACAKSLGEQRRYLPRVVALFSRQGRDDLRLVFTGARYELQRSSDAEDGQPFVAVPDPCDVFQLLARVVDDELELVDDELELGS